jgi:hypothetical protein
MIPPRSSPTYPPHIGNAASSQSGSNVQNPGSGAVTTNDGKTYSLTCKPTLPGVRDMVDRLFNGPPPTRHLSFTVKLGSTLMERTVNNVTAMLNGAPERQYPRFTITWTPNVVSKLPNIYFS